jgi:hypothetical protein
MKGIPIEAEDESTGATVQRADYLPPLIIHKNTTPIREHKKKFKDSA